MHEFTQGELVAAAVDLLPELDLWEIWQAPGVVDLVCRKFGVAALVDDPRGENFQWLEAADLFRIDGVVDAVVRDLIADGTAAEHCAEMMARAWSWSGGTVGEA